MFLFAHLGAIWGAVMDGAKFQARRGHRLDPPGHPRGVSCDELRVDAEDKSFSSYDAFKKVDLTKYYGPAGDGYQCHHIVEQSAEGDIAASELNSTSNIVRIPKLLHEEINSE
jgi:hypothetical protein